MSLTLQAALLAAAECPEPMVRFMNRSGGVTEFTWGQILDQAAATAQALRGLGVEPGDRVAIVLPTGPDFLHAYFGALLARAVPTPLYPPVRLARLDEYHATTARLLKAATVRLVLTDRACWGLLGKAMEQARLPGACHVMASLPRPGHGGGLVEPGSHEDLALVQFSSGTTVDPKPVALSQRNLLANIDAIVDSMPGDHSKHTALSWLPLYHDMGLIGCLLTPLLACRPITLLRPEDFVARPRLWLEALSQTRASITAAPNFAYGLCADRIDDAVVKTLDLSGLEIALCGAEPVMRDTLDRFVERFAPAGLRPEAITPVYGLAEATLAVTFSDPLRRARFVEVNPVVLAEERRVEECEGGRALASLGAPLPGMKVEVRGPEGQVLAEGQVGRLNVRGPSVSSGYLGCPQETARAFAEGWLDTGDEGFFHQGELYVSGRTKDIILVRGRKWDPVVVEAALAGVAGLRRGCAVAVSAALRGDTEDLCVLAERRADCRVGDDDLVAAVKQAVVGRTGLVAEQVLILDPGTLPRTSSGKLRRGVARERLLAGALHAAPAPGVLGVMRAQWQGWRAHRAATSARD